jgi:hypothetical protein
LLGYKFIPKTFTRCAELLLAAGDTAGLINLFEDFRSNIRNVHGERRLLVLRAVAGMLEKRINVEDKEVDSFSNISGVTSRSGMGVDTSSIIHEVKRALKENIDGDIEWVLPLFSWYLMDEHCADDVLDLLIEFRDSNIDHLPAHEPLLSFLLEEFSEEDELVSEHLKVFSSQFPWDERVLDYVEMVLKRGEEEGDSFDEDEEDGNVLQKEEDYKIVLPMLLDFLDYEVNDISARAWDLVGKCVHSLGQHDEGRELIKNLFSDRQGWWLKQNFGRLNLQDKALLVKKGKVLLFLKGSECPWYEKILNVVGRKTELAGWEGQVIAPCLLEERSDTRYKQAFLKQEWTNVKQMKEEEEKRLSEFKLDREYNKHLKPFEKRKEIELAKKFDVI